MGNELSKVGKFYYATINIKATVKPVDVFDTVDIDGKRYDITAIEENCDKLFPAGSVFRIAGGYYILVYREDGFSLHHMLSGNRWNDHVVARESAVDITPSTSEHPVYALRKDDVELLSGYRGVEGYIGSFEDFINEYHSVGKL